MSNWRVYVLTVMVLNLGGVLMADPTVSREEISTWSVVGGSGDQLLKDGEAWLIGPDVQIIRTIIGEKTILQIESRPLFGTVAAELPVIELGDVALTFLRNGSEGKLVLVLGRNPAITLPFKVPLADDGRSEQPLDITFSRIGETVAINVHDQTMHFPGGLAGALYEIVLSAGSSHSWPIRGLTVIGELQVHAAVADTRSHGKDEAENQALQVRKRAIEVQANVASLSAIEAAKSTSLRDERASDARAKQRGLEVFTPSSVRRGRADQVRQAAVETTQETER